MVHIHAARTTCSSPMSDYYCLLFPLLSSPWQLRARCEFRREMVTLTLGIFGELLQRSHQRGTQNVKQPSVKFKPLWDLMDPFPESPPKNVIADNSVRNFCSSCPNWALMDFRVSHKSHVLFVQRCCSEPNPLTFVPFNVLSEHNWIPSSDKQPRP